MLLRDDSPMSFPARKLGTKRALLPYLFHSCRIGQLLLVLASGAELLRGAHVLRALVFNYAPCAVLRAENRAEKSVKRVLGANSGFLSYAIRARAIQRSLRAFFRALLSSRPRAAKNSSSGYELCTQTVSRQIKTPRENGEASRRFFGGPFFRRQRDTS